MSQSKETKYTKIRDEIIQNIKENSPKIILLHGEYGSGKSILCESIKQKIENISVKIEDEMYFDNDVPFLAKANHSFAYRKRIHNFKNNLLASWQIVTAIILGLIPLFIWAYSEIDNKTLIILSISISCFYVSIYVIPVLAYVFKKLKKLRFGKKNVLIIENIDRFSWKKVLEFFAWARQETLNNNNTIIFTYSIDNLNDRYKEEYGFESANILSFAEKYVNQMYDLTEYKKTVGVEILSEILRENKLPHLTNEIFNNFPIEDANFRVFEKAIIEVTKPNFEKAYKYLELNIWLLIKIQYLKHSNINAYNWLKENISKIQNDENYEGKYDFLKTSIFVDGKMEVQVDNPSEKSFLNDSISILQMIREKIHHNVNPDGQALSHYFVTKPTLEFIELIESERTFKEIKYASIDFNLKEKLTLENISNFNVDEKLWSIATYLSAPYKWRNSEKWIELLEKTIKEVDIKEVDILALLSVFETLYKGYNSFWNYLGIDIQHIQPSNYMLFMLVIEKLDNNILYNSYDKIVETLVNKDNVVIRYFGEFVILINISKLIMESLESKDSLDQLGEFDFDSWSNYELLIMASRKINSPSLEQFKNYKNNYFYSDFIYMIFGMKILSWDRKTPIYDVSNREGSTLDKLITKNDERLNDVIMQFYTHANKMIRIASDFDYNKAYKYVLKIKGTVINKKIDSKYIYKKFSKT